MSRSRTTLTVLEDSCCPTTLADPLPRDVAEELAHLLKAVADPARLQLLSLIGRSADGQVCQCDLTGPLGLSQPTVSHHLRVLVDAGVLSRERRGSWVWFSLVPDRLSQIAAIFG
ncbi:MAG: ArsR family transcriptional regulator [Actinomycetota bacterium]|nr:MAG: ArsR family transcriptional regulator [Actinomycetota bacterium]